MQVPDQVQIYEVGLRDGLQLEDKLLSVEEKLSVLDLLNKADVKEVELGAFVHPKLVPQMANTGELFENVEKYENIGFIALVPNMKGLENAYKKGVKKVNYVLSVSDTHNLQNVRQSTEASIESFQKMSQFANKNDIELSVTMATTFGCPFEGTISESRVLSIIDKLLENNIKRITLADTTGMANPKQVYRLTKKVLDEWKAFEFACHFHNTRGMGLANILAGLDAGVTIYDSSLGGLGGCPFAPGATGNVCTEDVVHMLEEMGVKTSTKLDPLIEAAQKLQELLGHNLSGQVMKAGKSSRLYPVPR